MALKNKFEDIKLIVMKTIYAVIILSIAAATLVSCANSRITHSWKSDKASSERYNKILIVALDGNKDADLREKMENHLAGDLKQLGYVTSTASDKYGPKAFRNREEEEVIKNIEDEDIDAVITIVLLDKQKERHYVPGHVYFSPYVIYHRRFWTYYHTMHARIYSPGYYTMNTRYFWESNLYDVSTKELIYSVQTESFDPADAESAAHEYGKLIVKDMVRQKVLSGVIK